MIRDLQRGDLTVAVIGSGTMGRGIAQVCAQAGMTALLFDSRDGAAREAVAAIDKALDGLVAKGRMTADVKQGVMGRLRAIGSLDEVAPAGIVIEAIVEDLAAKRELFRALEQRIAPDAVIATNTSSLSVTEIAAGCGDPGRVGGLHFFNPPPLMRLVEVIGGLRSDPALVPALTGFVRRIGKHPVVATDTPGFVVNHAGRAYGPEALRIVAQGIAYAARGRPADEGGRRLPHGAVRTARSDRRRRYPRGDGEHLRSIFRRADVSALGATGRTGRRRPARPQDQAGLLQLRRPAGSQRADDRGRGAAQAGRGLDRRRRRRARTGRMARGRGRQDAKSAARRTQARSVS